MYRSRNSRAYVTETGSDFNLDKDWQRGIIPQNYLEIVFYRYKNNGVYYYQEIAAQ